MGDPGRWKEAVYEINGLRVRSKSSTIALLTRAFSRGRVRCLIIAADTVAIAGTGSASRMSYRQIRKAAAKYIKEKLQEILENSHVLSTEAKLPRTDDIADAVRISIAPGIGIFDGIEFRGSLALYYIYVLLGSLSLIMESGGGELELWLDLTHGVNYMPAITLSAVLDAALVYMLSAKNASLTIKVYNSDPYPMGQEGLPSLRINEMGPIDVKLALPPPASLDTSYLKSPHRIFEGDDARFAEKPRPK